MPTKWIEGRRLIVPKRRRRVTWSTRRGGCRFTSGHNGPALQADTGAVVSRGCRRPPRGWRCTRPSPHDGPCPTVPTWWNLVGAFFGRTKGLRW